MTSNVTLNETLLSNTFTNMEQHMSNNYQFNVIQVSHAFFFHSHGKNE